MPITITGGSGQQQVGYETGEVCFFAMSTAPTGFLACNGAAVSRSTYSGLFAAIGTTYGAGDGSTTFNLPDLRGEFIRGWDGGRGVDSGRGFASSQTDALQGHWHQIVQSFSGTQYGASPVTTRGSLDLTSTDQARGLISDGTNGTPRTAAETRPRNVALLACIRY